MESEQETALKLSNGTSFNDLEWPPQTQMSRSDRSVTLNISEIAKDTAIVTMESEQETAPKLSNGTIFNDFEWPLTHISRSR